MTEAQDTQASQPTAYELLGGEAGVRRLVERFYAVMDREPALEVIRRMHPPMLDRSIDNLFWFLSGWLGGPPIYVEKRGHPMLRARHLPFSIGEAERDQWVACMIVAMEEEGVEENLRKSLTEAFYKTADWMRNQAGSPAEQMLAKLDAEGKGGNER